MITAPPGVIAGPPVVISRTTVRDAAPLGVIPASPGAITVSPDGSLRHSSACRATRRHVPSLEGPGGGSDCSNALAMRCGPRPSQRTVARQHVRLARVGRVGVGARRRRVDGVEARARGRRPGRSRTGWSRSRTSSAPAWCPRGTCRCRAMRADDRPLVRAADEAVLRRLARQPGLGSAGEGGIGGVTASVGRGTEEMYW